MCVCVHTWVQWGWADTTHTTGDRHPQVPNSNTIPHALAVTPSLSLLLKTTVL